MLIPKGDGSFLGGPADVICIVKVPTGTFHVSFWEEHPLPGPICSVEDLEFIQVKSKMHNTKGAVTLEEALVELDDLRKKIELPDHNIVRNYVFEVDDPFVNRCLPNWIAQKVPLETLLLS